MSEQPKEGTRYETIYILKADLTEEGSKKTHDKISEVIGRASGRIDSVKDLGVKQLAYRIARQTRGHYFQLNFCGPGRVVEEMERYLRLSEEVIRFLTVRERKPRGVPT